MIYDILCPVCKEKVGESEIEDLVIYHEEHKPLPEVDVLEVQKSLCRDKIKFGKNIVLEFLAENTMLKLDISQTISCLTKLMDVKVLLEIGALETALAAISMVEPDEVITKERIGAIQANLRNFLGM
jgi:hypothetical protein